MRSVRSIFNGDFRFIIFSLIGVFNTIFDIILYVVIYDLSKSIIIANLVATSAALLGSYMLNSHITFKARRWTLRSFVLFVVVTVFGLWVLQTGIIEGLTPLVHHIPEHLWQHFGHLEKFAKTIIPKLVSVSATFIWNFIWYNRVIFKQDKHRAEEAIIAAEL